MKTIVYALFLTCISTLIAVGQSPPSCNSSDLRYLNLVQDATGVTLLFAVSPPHPMVQSYFLSYTLQIDTDPTSGSLPVPVPGVPQSFSGLPNTGLHAFTARNVCMDGAVHTGATWFLDFRQADEACPAIRDFQLLDLTPNFIAFAWGASPQADSFRVSYQAGASPSQTAFTPEPVWEQPLSPATVHTFRIAALCTVPGLTRAAVAEGPEFRFSIIIIDDIKAVAVPWDSIRTTLCHSYRIQCTQHGDFGTNKEAFIAAHPQLGAAVPCPQLVGTQAQATGLDGLQITPNPADGQGVWCAFQLKASGPVEIDLIDFSGKVHRCSQEWLPGGAHRILIPTEFLPPGLYTLRILCGGRFFATKLVKY